MGFAGCTVLLSVGLPASSDDGPTNVGCFMAIRIPLSPQCDGRDIYWYRIKSGYTKATYVDSHKYFQKSPPSSKSTSNGSSTASATSKPPSRPALAPAARYRKPHKGSIRIRIERLNTYPTCPHRPSRPRVYHPVGRKRVAVHSRRNVVHRRRRTQGQGHSQY